MLKIVSFLAFSLLVTPAFADKAEEALKGSLAKAVKFSFLDAKMIPADQADAFAESLAEKFIGSGEMPLTAGEKAAIGDGSLKVEGYDDVLKRWEALAKVVGRMPYGSFLKYARTDDLKEVDKLALTKMLTVLEGSEKAMKISRLLMTAKMVAGNYLLYVSGNGKEPSELELLDGDGKLAFVHPETGKAGHWIVLEKAAQFPTKKEPGRKVVIMAPVAIEGVRIVGLNDGAAVTIPEDTVPEKYQTK